ncbi:fanconi anemia group I-like protein, partial [Thalictrum thalictroides]
RQSFMRRVILQCIINDAEAFKECQFERADMLGQCEDSGLQSSEEEKASYLASLLSGIVEVFINVISTELEKAIDVKKVELEKELIEFIYVHDSLEMEAHTTKKGSSLKRVTPMANPHDVVDKADFENEVENYFNAGGEDDSERVSGNGDQNTKNIQLLLEKRPKPLLSELLDLSLCREMEVLSDIVLLLGNKLSCNIMNYNGAWAGRMCRNSNLETSKAAKSLVTLAIQLSSPPNALIAAQEMVSELLKVLGAEENDPVEISETYPVINHSAWNVVGSTLLHLVESVIAV